MRGVVLLLAGVAAGAGAVLLVHDGGTDPARAAPRRSPPSGRERGIEARLASLERAVQRLAQRVPAAEPAPHPEPEPGPGPSAGAGAGADAAGAPTPVLPPVGMRAPDRARLRELAEGLGRAFAAGTYGEFRHGLEERYLFRSVRAILEEFGRPDEIDESRGRLKWLLSVPGADDREYLLGFTFRDGVVWAVAASSSVAAKRAQALRELREKYR